MFETKETMRPTRFEKNETTLLTSVEIALTAADRALLNPERTLEAMFETKETMRPTRFEKKLTTPLTRFEIAVTAQVRALLKPVRMPLAMLVTKPMIDVRSCVPRETAALISAPSILTMPWIRPRMRSTPIAMKTVEGEAIPNRLFTVSTSPWTHPVISVMSPSAADRMPSQSPCTRLTPSMMNCWTIDSSIPPRPVNIAMRPSHAPLKSPVRRSAITESACPRAVRTPPISVPRIPIRSMKSVPTVVSAGPRIDRRNMAIGWMIPQSAAKSSTTPWMNGASPLAMPVTRFMIPWPTDWNAGTRNPMRFCTSCPIDSPRPMTVLRNCSLLFHAATNPPTSAATPATTSAATPTILPSTAARPPSERPIVPANETTDRKLPTSSEIPLTRLTAPAISTPTAATTARSVAESSGFCATQSAIQDVMS